MLEYLLAWLPMVAIAIANGFLREKGYGKHVTELAAHQISTVTALLFFSAYIWLVLRRWPPVSLAEAASIGLLWLALTIAFELLFGHYVAGQPWSRLLRDYNLVAGRLWVFVPLWVALAPVVFALASRHRGDR